MGMNSIIFLAVEPAVIKDALLNSVMCISIVFILLIFISFVISLFKYINKVEQKFSKKDTVIVPIQEAAESEELIYEEELSDDLELAAVITAAIYAYEESAGVEVSTDGLVVRSIRRSNKSRW